MPTTIDLTPTWGEWGNIFYRFAVSGEIKALETLHPDYAKAMAAAQALTTIRASLTAEQEEQVNAILHTEMAKQRIHAQATE